VRRVWGGGLFLTLCGLLLLLRCAVFVAVGDLLRIHVLICAKQCRLNSVVEALQREVAELPEGADKARKVKSLAETGLHYETTYTWNQHQYDNKLRLLKMAQGCHYILLMLTEGPKEMTKVCFLVLQQKSRAAQQQKRAALADLRLAASPMHFLQGTELGHHDDYERFIASAHSAERQRSATAPIQRGSSIRYSNHATRPSYAVPQRGLQLSSHSYATVPSRSMLSPGCCTAPEGPLDEEIDMSVSTNKIPRHRAERRGISIVNDQSESMRESLIAPGQYCSQ